MKYPGFLFPLDCGFPQSSGIFCGYPHRYLRIRTAGKKNRSFYNLAWLERCEEKSQSIESCPLVTANILLNEVSMPDQCLEGMPDICNQFLVVADSLRKIADQLSSFDLNFEPEKLTTISSELKQIGWNTLFVSSSIDTLLLSVFPQSNIRVLKDHTDLLNQINGLQVAADYLARTIHYLTPDDLGTSPYHLEIHGAFLRLGDMLMGVAGECKRI